MGLKGGDFWVEPGKGALGPVGRHLSLIVPLWTWVEEMPTFYVVTDRWNIANLHNDNGLDLTFKGSLH